MTDDREPPTGLEKAVRRGILGLAPYTWFRIFKYGVYLLLCYNAFLFFQQDFRASSQTFTGGVSWDNLVSAFSATVDTVAWVVLLLIFELETAVIPDHVLRGRTRWILLALSGVCYFFILAAFHGYWIKFGMISNHSPVEIADLCSLIGSPMTYVITLDEYAAITEAVCASLQGQALLQIHDTQMIGSEAAIAEAVRLAIVDIINAGDWLLVVALLQFEVYMRVRGSLSNRTVQLATIAKVVLYTTLFGCAVYWWFRGDFLAFWDAFLWLVAFIFIEMNIFDWSQEKNEDRLPGSHSQGQD